MTATRILRLLGAATVLTFLAVAFTPTPDRLSHWMSLADPLRKAEAIVVLGGGGLRDDGTLTDTSLRRTFHGISLYRRELAPVLILSGPASPTGHVEAEVRAEFARACGIAPTAVLTESRGFTTRDEGAMIGELLRRRGIGRILLVADAEGMRRATGVFTRHGFEVVAAPASDVASGGSPENRLDLMRRVLMELVGWLYYRISGYL